MINVIFFFLSIFHIIIKPFLRERKKGKAYLFTHLPNYCSLFKIWKSSCVIKLDRVGPVDNRPSTDKLHHFVKKTKQKINKKLTCDTWHVTCDMWHVTRDTFGVVNILSKFQLPNSYRLWFMILWRSGEEKAYGLTDWINESMTRLFIEQPRLHRVC